MSYQHVFINGEWRESAGTKTFRAFNPRTEEILPNEYPVSPWTEIEQALDAAQQAYWEAKTWPGERFAAFLDLYADEIETRTGELVEMAHAETALPVSPRLKDGELPRTTGQLRQAANAARSNSWRLPRIDTQNNIRSQLESIGPVAVFGPNNFPFAFNGISGGDFAAAIAAGNPVIAKGHSSHPGTTRIFAEAAKQAALATDMPNGFVQMIYRMSHEDGEKFAADSRLAAIGYTGSRSAGLKLKAAADRAGTPIYLELSSINPVFILKGALQERSAQIAEEFTSSCLMGTGQFCTNPGLVVLINNSESEKFLEDVTKRFQETQAGVMLSEGVQQHFQEGIETLKNAGAELVTGGGKESGTGIVCQNTLLRISGSQFLEQPEIFQTEAFGNSSLFVFADDVNQMADIAFQLEGNLTGCLYSHTGGADDVDCEILAPVLVHKVGRYLNDKMPTGVAVTDAMNHGGPFPATGHPGFTAVGLPASIGRFAMLKCYDNVREHRLPETLQDNNGNRSLWRLVDGIWSPEDIS